MSRKCGYFAMALFVFLAFIHTACEDELHVVDSDYITYPVVYGLINPEDSIYKIRLQRSFCGALDAHLMAKEADSLFFNSASVSLEVFKNGIPIARQDLEKIQQTDKEEGLFAKDQTFFYGVPAEELQIIPRVYSVMGKYNKVIYDDYEIAIEIHIPDHQIMTSAKTFLPNKPTIIAPGRYNKTIYFYNTDPFQIIFTNDSRYYEMWIVTNYKETIDGFEYQKSVTQKKLLEFQNYNVRATDANGVFVNDQEYFTNLAKLIKDTAQEVQRKFIDIDVVLFAMSDSYADYIRLSKFSDDLSAKPYSNLENGLGLFSAYTKSETRGLGLGNKEMDSLASGQYTKHLNFIKY